MFRKGYPHNGMLRRQLKDESKILKYTNQSFLPALIELNRIKATSMPSLNIEYLTYKYTIHNKLISLTKRTNALSIIQNSRSYVFKVTKYIHVIYNQKTM